MKKRKACLLIGLFILSLQLLIAQQRNDHYINNQVPLKEQPYAALPLGAIEAKGWLQKMLEIQRDGLTGQLDSIYEIVCGPNNGWLGGTGDGWERGPYWIDGLLPLAYILNDNELKRKAQKWVEWSIKNQRSDGYFGPLPLPEEYEKIPGTQQANREDWWPKMVMLKVLQQYYSATEDPRVIQLMTKYFKYQLKNLPKHKLGKWTYWANRRGGDNLMIVYWLYNITQEPFLLELAELIHEQTFNWTEVYSNNTIRKLSPLPRLHCVNVAQGLKEPIVYYQQHPEGKYLSAVKKGLDALKEVHGFVNGMYGGDEGLHGNNPTQGIELCSAVEMMFSFETILPITGDPYYADYLEKLAYNVLPTQHDDQFLRKQYFQQVNQVQITDQVRNFFNDDNARICYGVLTGYPCCTTNMHQGWPKFVQNLWYATGDNGLAALVYGASKVRAKVGEKGLEVRFTETTNYPFSGQVDFVFQAEKEVSFPLHLRIPAWCDSPSIRVNGEEIEIDSKENIVIINRKWSPGDSINMVLPMEIETSFWYERSVGVERGPLVYALGLEEEWKEVKTVGRDHTFYEVLPKSPWNYGLSSITLENKDFVVEEKKQAVDMPWNLENAPLVIKTKACRVPQWGIYQNSAGNIPGRVRMRKEDCKEEEITLYPYGSTTLRVGQFPFVNFKN